MANAKKKSTEVAETKASEVSTDVGAIDMFADAGAGNENVTSKDLIIPFMKVVQPLSNVMKKTHDDYLEEAEAGMIYNTATKELHPADEGIIIVPVQYVRHYIEWDDPDGNGQFVADHGPDDSVLNGCTVDEKGRNITADDNVIYETGLHYVLVVDPADGSFQQAVISMDRSQLKGSKQLNGLVLRKVIVHPETGEKATAPRYGFAYRMKTKTRNNDKGEWETWFPEDYGSITDLPDAKAIYNAAKAFNKTVATGTVKTEEQKSDGSGSGKDGF